jgi:hypothetical protein
MGPVTPRKIRADQGAGGGFWPRWPSAASWTEAMTRKDERNLSILGSRLHRLGDVDSSGEFRHQQNKGRQEKSECHPCGGYPEYQSVVVAHGKFTSFLVTGSSSARPTGTRIPVRWAISSSPGPGTVIVPNNRFVVPDAHSC